MMNKQTNILFFVLYHLMLSGNFQGSEIRHGIFWGLIFGPGIFLGFVGSPKDFFWALIFPPFDHPRHLKSGVPPPPPLRVHGMSAGKYLHND